MSQSKRLPRLRWLLLGIALVQVAWIAALPPFRGVDEFDHAYRAYAVAHGDWVAEPTAATRGTGASLVVSPALVAAAQPECERYAYTETEDCVGRPVAGGVEVASGAGRYNPLFYLVVGSPTIVVDGIGALYFMRMLTALWCLAFLALGMSCLRRWAPPAASIGILIALSPVVIFSSSIVAPNGVEIMASVALWMGLASLAFDPEGTNRYLVACALAGSAVTLLRSLGPLWAVLILFVACVAFAPLYSRLKALSRTRSGVVWLTLTALSAVLSVLWIVTQRSLDIGMPDDQEITSFGSRAIRALEVIPLWILQAVAAYPSRTDPAPPLVYASFFLMIAALVVLATVYGGSRARRGIALAATLSLAIPYAMTVATMDKFGVAWQGRYGLPLLVGIPIVAGISFARSGRWFPIPVMMAFGGLWTVAQVLGPTSVGSDELQSSPLAGTDYWALQIDPWLLGALGLVGSAMAVSAVLTNRKKT